MHRPANAHPGFVLRLNTRSLAILFVFEYFRIINPPDFDIQSVRSRKKHIKKPQRQVSVKEVNLFIRQSRIRRMPLNNSRPVINACLPKKRRNN